MLEKEQFDEICSKLSVDEGLKKLAIAQYTEISKNTILDVSNQCADVFLFCSIVLLRLKFHR
jgi:hypothetical protein